MIIFPPVQFFFVRRLVLSTQLKGLHFLCKRKTQNVVVCHIQALRKRGRKLTTCDNLQLSSLTAHVLFMFTLIEVFFCPDTNKCKLLLLLAVFVFDSMVIVNRFFFIFLFTVMSVMHISLLLQKMRNINIKYYYKYYYY